MADEEKRVVKPVVHVDQDKVKKSTGRQFMNSLIIDDFGIVKDYLLFDVLGPAIQNTIIDGLCGAITTIFGGNMSSRNYRGNTRGWNSSPSGKTSYGTIYRTQDTGIFNRQNDKRSYDEPIWNRRASTDYMDIPFESRPDAEKVLDEMRDCVERYGVISVADFYEMVDYKPGNNYSCNNYGWTVDQLRNVSITWSHGAWYIALPRAIAI